MSEFRRPFFLGGLIGVRRVLVFFSCHGLNPRTYQRPSAVLHTHPKYSSRPWGLDPVCRRKWPSRNTKKHWWKTRSGHQRIRIYLHPLPYPKVTFKFTGLEAWSNQSYHSKRRLCYQPALACFFLLCCYFVYISNIFTPCSILCSGIIVILLYPAVWVKKISIMSSEVSQFAPIKSTATVNQIG